MRLRRRDKVELEETTHEEDHAETSRRLEAAERELEAHAKRLRRLEIEAGMPHQPLRRVQ